MADSLPESVRDGPADLTPAAERIIRQLESLSAPLVVLHGWRGQGAQGVLHEMLARRTHAVVWPHHTRPGEAAAAAEPGSPERCWVTTTEPPADVLQAFARRAGSRQRLLVALERLPDHLPAEATVVPPGEIAVDPWELVSAADRIARPLDPASARRLVEICDGWWDPLRFVVASEDALPTTSQEFADRDRVREFLDGVLDELDASERGRWLKLALAGVESPIAPGAAALLSRAECVDMVDRCLQRGWLMPSTTGPRLPRLLTARLARRAEERPLSQQRSVRSRLRLGQEGFDPLAALAHPARYRSPAGVSRALLGVWPTVLERLPVDRLEHATSAALLEEGGDTSEPVLALLRSAVRGLSAEAATLPRLAELADLEGEAAVQAAARLLAACFGLLSGETVDLPEEDSALPAALHGLARAARRAASATRDTSTEGWDVVWRAVRPRAGREPSVCGALILRLAALAARGEPETAAWLRARLGGLPDPWRRDLLRRLASAEAEIEFRIGLLGPVRIERRDGRTGEWRRLDQVLARERLALAILALAGRRGVSREQLAEELFPARSKEFVERNLHPTLSRLRRALTADLGDVPDPVPYAGGRWRLAEAYRWTVDLELERDLIEQGREYLDEGRRERAVVCWRRAWELGAGDLLQGFDAVWIDGLRDGRRDRRVTMLRRLGGLLEETGELHEAVDVYRSLLRLEPLSEEIHLRLMRLYRHRGRRDLVHRQYERLSSLLDEHLGTHPSAETTVAFREFMR